MKSATTAIAHFALITALCHTLRKYADLRNDRRRENERRDLDLG